MKIYETWFCPEESGLSLRGLFRQLQEAASAQSSLMGWGYEQMNGHGCMWVVTRYQVLLDRWPEARERILLRTWPGRTRHGMYLRQYQLLDAAGERIARAGAVWAVVDRQTRRMLQPAQSGVEMPEVSTGEDLPMPPAPGKGMEDRSEDYLVPEEVLDENGHMNNTRYFDLAQRCLEPELTRLREIRAEYASEVLSGDRLTLRWLREEERGLLRGESSRAGTHFRLELRYGK